MSNIQKILILVGVTVLCSLLYGFSLHKQNSMRFASVEIEITGDHQFQFVSPRLVEKLLTNHGSYIMGQVIDSVNIQSIEQRVNDNPFVKKAEVYADLDGTINVVVEPRIPILRVVTPEGKGFYIDEDGYTMPISDQYVAKVIPCTGLLVENKYVHSKLSIENNEKLMGVWRVAQSIAKDSLFTKQFVQLDVDKDNVIVLIPRVGNHEIILGEPIDVERKFRNLKAFYSRGIEQSNWNIYESIDLSFNGQVVCKKK